MSKLCESLENEHRVIEGVLNAMEAEAGRIEAGRPVNRIFLTSAVAFVREFADGVHHQKEEKVLFPQLEVAGVPRDGGPVGVMLSEHDEGRGHIRAIIGHLDAAVSGDDQAKRGLVQEIGGYVALLRAHIHKEEMVLFPMAEKILGDSQQAATRSGFAAAENSQAVVMERHRQWARSLATMS